MQDSFQVELATALLEEVLETLAEQVHDHDVEHLTVVRLFVSHEVQEGYEGLAAQLVNQLRLPEEHNMALHFHCFFLSGSNTKTLSTSSIKSHFTVEELEIEKEESTPLSIW